jgi:UDP-N-acetylglucosamine:LPS N-acetylglucosamine transferase
MKKIAMPDVKFLVSSNAELPFEDVIRIQTDETETQNYIAMCDLVVTKAGYSTVSESIRAQVPMVMFKREGYKEDELIVHAIEELGIGRHISDRAFLEGGWLNELDELCIYTYRKKFDTMGDRYKEDGTLEILSTIKEVAL